MFKKYKWNFVVFVLGASIVGFFIFDIIFYHYIRDYLYDQTFREMYTKTNLVVKLLEQENLQALPNDLPALYNLTYQTRHIVNARITIIDSTGRVLTDSDVSSERVQFMDNHLNRPEVQQAIVNGWGQSYRKSETVNRKIFYTAFQLKYHDKPMGFLRLAYYAQHFEESMSTILTFLIVANLIGLVVLFWFAYFLGLVATVPISKIIKIAHKISDGNLDLTFPVHRNDEIADLSIILNQLTEQLKTQIRCLSDEQTKLQTILAKLDIGVIVIDQHRHILHANPETARILNLNDWEMHDKSIVEILRFDPLLTAIDRTLQLQSKETGEFVHYVGSEKIFISFIIMPFLINEKKHTGALVQLQDITELKKLEAIRRDFVVNASHELKTPLTSIIGYTETLLAGAAKFTDVPIKFIRRIREQAQRLEFLIADLLKLSQVENDVPLELKNIRLNPLIKEIINEFNERANQKELAILSESPVKNLVVKADDELLRTAFNNLIDNAIKYTPQNGKITIRVSEVNSNRVRIEISDTGIGIDPKYHDRIFQRFYRIDKSRSFTLGGTGLGLAIVKHIIEKHKSQIFVDSKLGEGSCFWFELEKG